METKGFPRSSEEAGQILDDDFLIFDELSFTVLNSV